MQNANYVSTERGSFWHRQTVLTTLTNREAEPSGTEARLAFLRGRKQDKTQNGTYCRSGKRKQLCRRTFRVQGDESDVVADVLTS